MQTIQLAGRGLGWLKAAAAAGAGNEGVTSNPFLSLSLLDATLDGDASHSACFGCRSFKRCARCSTTRVLGETCQSSDEPKVAEPLVRARPHSFTRFPLRWHRPLVWGMMHSRIFRVFSLLLLLLDLALDRVFAKRTGPSASLLS